MEEKNTSTQELKNGFLDRNQLTKSQKVESRVIFTHDYANAEVDGLKLEYLWCAVLLINNSFHGLCLLTG